MFKNKFYRRANIIYHDNVINFNFENSEKNETEEEEWEQKLAI